ncbi:hypothetical protein [Caenispirillum salinarum]|uniref:hypothetical protein n=1 Tax=Caenispirillum salinarum TaxID=859058 RepID=UPI00384F47E9
MMTSMMKRLKTGAVVLTAVATLSACATGPKLDQANMNADERQLASYAGEDYVEQYAMQAGLAGAAGGAIAGCIIAAVAGASCEDGALIGAGIGGLAGVAYGAEAGRQTAQLAQHQLGEEQALAVAAQELDDARASNRAAQAVVTQQGRRLASLRERMEAGTASRAQYDAALEDAKQAEMLIGGSRDKLRDSLGDIEKRIDTERDRGGDTAKLTATYESLKKEADNLDRQLAVLTSDREATEALMASS